ncbi:MAG: IgGFc-binding protein, partial [Nannocystaceae bacterium]
EPSESESEATTDENCVCIPGQVDGCDGDDQLLCADDCQGFAPVPCDGLAVCVGGGCQPLFCAPGSRTCEGADAYKVCNEEGSDYGDVIPCDDGEECQSGICLTLCALAESDPSSVGCVFRGNKMQNFDEEPSSVVIGNVSETHTANVQLYYYEGDAEQAEGGAVQVAPGQSHEFVLTKPGEPGPVSVLRDGGTFKVVSDVPVVAYQHSPIDAEAHNDSSMLLPDHAQRQDYIVAAYTPSVGGNPAYFNVIALEDNTVVEWTPPDGTAAGTGVMAVGPGQTGMATLGDGDMLQVTNGQGDVSGTYLKSTAPVWAVGAVQCVNVPSNITFCDHIEEQLIPLEYWGEEYVGAHAPKRGNEDYWWRVYSGDAAVTIDTTPQQPGFPVTLDQGEFYEFSTQSSFIFAGDGPFMPVQYLESQDGGAGTGDPASYQMVPVEQFLDRYVFVTGSGYTFHYAQVIREAGGAPVLIDGVEVSGYYPVGGYEVADWPISEGAHLAESNQTFGIYQVGYTGVTSYAYPGGLQLEVINPIR